MNTLTLAELEQAAEPYRRAGFAVTSQSEGALTLAPPTKKFSYLFFIFTLILLWPVAVVYLISFNNRKGKSVCLRITSRGYIEESGYTLRAMARERKRIRLINALLFALLGVIILIILTRVYLSRV
jgi:ABC-type spermidine/putrescine transport system permease subunit II